MTLSAAKELAPKNIRVNAVAPGFIDTEMTRQLPPRKFEQRLEGIRMGRIGAPGEVAQAIVFLASDLASYITGQVLGVDGGMVI
jgi:3-oxoacyl-[acyl-carrier protein] reductase